MTQHNTTQDAHDTTIHEEAIRKEIGGVQDLRDWSTYFDDLEGHIEMLETEAGITPDSEHEDALKERITYLKTLSDTWIDNDITASPDAWKTLATFSNVAALEQYCKWTDDD